MNIEVEYTTANGALFFSLFNFFVVEFVCVCV